MLCLDTYAIVEIGKSNPKFSFLLNEEFVIADLTIAEFYSLLYREGREDFAKYWYERLKFYCKSVDKDILIKALKYRIDNKNTQKSKISGNILSDVEDLSFFDCVGYIYALENNLKFVTGDKAFKGREGVLFIEK